MNSTTKPSPITPSQFDLLTFPECLNFLNLLCEVAVSRGWEKHPRCLVRGHDGIILPDPELESDAAGMQVILKACLEAFAAKTGSSLYELFLEMLRWQARKIHAGSLEDTQIQDLPSERKPRESQNQAVQVGNVNLVQGNNYR